MAAKRQRHKKAQRFFKDRGIRFQYVDLREKTLSKGEFRSVAAVNGGLEGMINKECKDRDALALVTYIAEEDKLDKILENPQILKIPIVRNGRQATLGYQPDVWKTMGIKEAAMNQDTLNKIKSYKKFKICMVCRGGRCRFFDWHLPRRTFQGFDFLCGMCSGSNFICHFSKIVNKIYQKRMEAKNNAYGFDYLAEYNIYKKMRKQDAKDDGILYVTEYSDWKARIQKNYEQQKENEDFCHFLVQKKRDIENLKNKWK